MSGILVLLCAFVLTQSANAYRDEPLASNASSLLQFVHGEYDTADVITKRSLLPSVHSYSQCSIDCVVVLDTSGSICDDWQVNSCGNWEKLARSAASFVDKLKRSDGARVGLLTFDNNAKWHHRLTSQTDKVAKHIRDIRYGDVSDWLVALRYTNIEEGLNKAGRELKDNGKSGNRPVVLMFTDGEPTKGGDWLTSPKDAAKNAAYKVKRHSQLAMVAIKKANTAFMRGLADRSSFFAVDDFNGLQDDFIDQLTSKICSEGHTTLSPTPKPTQTLSPTPSPISTFCEKDTRAPCETPSGLCFQHTRGKTECKVSKIDGQKTCHCIEDHECVYNRSFYTTKGGHWGGCRSSDDEYRGEDNAVNGFS